MSPFLASSGYSALCAVPNEFTLIPFALKAMKLLVNELRSGGEPSGLKASDIVGSKSDDEVCWAPSQKAPAI